MDVGRVALPGQFGNVPGRFGIFQCQEHLQWFFAEQKTEHGYRSEETNNKLWCSWFYDGIDDKFINSLSNIRPITPDFGGW